VAFRHDLRCNIFFGNTCFTGRFFDPFFCQQFFFRNQFLVAQPLFFPYPVYTVPYYQVAEQTPSTVAYRESDLPREVERLTDEVERLREEEASRERAQQAVLQPRPSVDEKATTTILVFRDGRRNEVKNFAIVGQTPVHEPSSTTCAKRRSWPQVRPVSPCRRGVGKAVSRCARSINSSVRASMLAAILRRNAPLSRPDKRP
jgi:hypothetical protein